MFIAESSNGILQRIKIIYVLDEENSRDPGLGPRWTWLENGSGCLARMRLAFIGDIVRETTWTERRLMRT
jgi:hypothetical protein